jgi:nitrogen fixation protein FixH
MSELGSSAERRSKLRWVLAIVGLLVGNLLAMVFLAVAANTGGAEVIPDYYERASNYNDEIDEAARSRALGWTAQLALGATTIEVSLRDQVGASIAGAKVRVSGYPRAHASRRIDATLDMGAPGTYRVTLARPAIGWHDLTIHVERNGEQFSRRVVVEPR